MPVPTMARPRSPGTAPHPGPVVPLWVDFQSLTAQSGVSVPNQTCPGRVQGSLAAGWLYSKPICPQVAGRAHGPPACHPLQPKKMGKSTGAAPSFSQHTCSQEKGHCEMLAGSGLSSTAKNSRVGWWEAAGFKAGPGTHLEPTLSLSAVRAHSHTFNPSFHPICPRVPRLLEGIHMDQNINSAQGMATQAQGTHRTLSCRRWRCLGQG